VNQAKPSKNKASKAVGEENKGIPDDGISAHTPMMQQYLDTVY
jgi:hypothetical protein